MTIETITHQTIQKKINSIVFLFLFCFSSIYSQNLFINEFVASNDSGLTDELGEFEDWVEIYNPGTAAIDIGGMYLSDDLSDPTLWQIPTTNPNETTIPAGGFLVLFFDKSTDQGILHVDAKLSGDGEAIGLFAPDGVTVIDSLTYGVQITDVSRGRSPDGSPDMAFFTQPTPGATNDTPTGLNQADIPVADIGGGFYPSGALTVSLTSTNPGATIYYTLDASDPDDRSREYTGPITIDEITTLRAIAYNAPQEPSKILTHTYLLNISHDPNFAIIALNTDPDHLYDSEEGMFNNFDDNIEQPAHIAFYEPDGSLGFAQDVEIELHGTASRSLGQKSLKIKAKASLGSEFFEYQIFPDLPYDSYRSFLLRQSGQDWNKTWFRDAMSSNLFTELTDLDGLVEEPDLDAQGYRPSVVYLNGEYYGIYNVREQMNWKYLDTHYGLGEDEVDINENQLNEVATGDDIAWLDLQDFLEDNNFSNQANYDSLKSLVDVDNYFDYHLMNMLIDNNDWPGNNNKRWRERTPDGKWRWFNMDLDFGFGLRPINAGWESGDFTTDMVSVVLADNSIEYYNPPNVTLLLRRMIENEAAKTYFINRAADLLNTVFTKNRILDRINIFENMYANEMDAHMDVWQSGWNGTPAKVEKLRSFAKGRTDEVREHFIDYFREIDGPTDVTLNANPVQGGSIEFSTITAGETHFPWEGIYFRGIEIPVSATPNRGYFFTGWSDSSLGNAPETSVTINTSSYNLTANFILGSTASDQIVINEINYNSPDDVDPGDWVELYNPNIYPVDISGWYFEDESGDFFSLPSGTIMPPDSYYLLVEEEALFFSVFPGMANVIGDFAKKPSDFKLSGKGERITLSNAAGVLIDEVDFDDKSPWPEEADGNGPTLQLITPDLDNNVPESWVAIEATPGAINSSGLSITCPQNIVEIIAVGSGGINVGWMNPTLSESCDLGIATLTQITGPGNGGFFATGITTITYEATDPCGKSAQCSFEIEIIESNGTLDLNCPANITVSTLPGLNTSVANWSTPTVASTCPAGGGSTMQISGLPSGSNFPLGVNTISYEAMDNCSNFQTCSFLVTVTSTASVIDITCPDNISAIAPQGATGNVVTWNDAQATTNCGVGNLGITQTLGLTSGSFFPIGNYTVAYEAINGCGVSQTCSFNIEVREEVQTVTLDCPSDLTILLPEGAASTSIRWNEPIASTSCGGGVKNQNCDTNDLTGFTFIGELGNSKYFESTIKDTWDNGQNYSESFGGHLAVIEDEAENQFIEDNVTSKVFIGLRDSNNEGIFEWVNGAPFNYNSFSSGMVNTAADDYAYLQSWDGRWKLYAENIPKYYLMELNCASGSPITLTQTGGPLNGSNVGPGTYTITYQATDDCGGVATCNFTLTVEDNPTGLEINCPTNIVVSEAPGTGGANVIWSDATATSPDCNGAMSVQQIGGSLNGTFFPIGTQTVTYQASDVCGNSENCDFTVTVNPDVLSTSYCESNGEAPWKEHIVNVTFGTINNTSTKEGYGDFTNQSTTVSPGDVYPISILPKFSWKQYDEYIQVWIDYNGDFDFLDQGELAFATIRPAESSGSTVSPIVGNIAIPNDAISGNTRMRVSMSREAYAAPCELFPRGEVEDYSIEIEGIMNKNGQSPHQNSLLENRNNEVIRNQSVANFSADMTIFPNPAKEQITLKSTLFEEGLMNIKLVNILGQPIKEWSNFSVDGNSAQLMLGKQINGTYLLIVQQGKKVATKRFVIKQ